MPERPAATLSNSGPGQLPTGETMPIPVTTTRRGSCMFEFRINLIEHITERGGRLAGLVKTNIETVLDLEHEFDGGSPVYLQISKDDLILHLSEHHGDCCPGSTVFVWMNGIEKFHATITSRGYGYMRPGIERTFYNSLCVEVTDPFGNRIRFNEQCRKESPVASPAIAEEAESHLRQQINR